MRKIFTLLAAAIVAATMFATEGALPGAFTINANGDKIQFSKGNLQYNATLGSHATVNGTAQGTWRFAENQWETISKEDNDQASSTFDGWIDNFVWGTSGYNDKYPYMTSTDYEDYLGLVTKEEETWGTKYDVTDIIGTNYDWGVYNAISNGGNQANVWRALTQDEIKYLTARNNGTLWGVGVVNGVIGIIFLPDDWSTPQGLTFKCDNSNELDYISPMLFDYQAYFYRTSDNAENINVYDDNDWRYMEVAGAVFMPSVYYTGKDYYHNPYEGGDYWTSQAWGFSYDDDVTLAKGFSLSCSAQGVSRVWFDNEKIFLRRAVRLVQTYDGTGTAQEPELEPKALTGRFSVSDDKQVIFAQGNLQYKASSNEWKFANSQYDMIGAGNANVSASYKGWMDLFGWGTAANPTETSKESAPYTSFTDWTTNTIENADGKTWYTMPEDEWNYLLSTRAGAADKHGQAVVNDVKGYILLPDEWSLPEGLSFTATPYNYTTNVYTASQWEKLEAAGAVFLPAAGFRYGIDINGLPAGNGYYWTPTPSSQYDDMAQALMISEYSKAKVNAAMPCNGYSVRPVTEYAVPKTYTVTFVDWDGTVLKTEEVKEGGTATPPADPTREGYLFTGWSKAGTIVTSDMTAEAYYKKCSGTCGQNLTWTFDPKTGTLTIEGSGDMDNYDLYLPWGYPFVVKQVVLPDGLTTIGDNAFWSCGITSVVIPEGVTTIGKNAFQNCYHLTSVTIPASVTTIGEYAFYDCSTLETIYNYAVTPQPLEYSVFSGVNQEKCTLYVPAIAVEEYMTADQWDDFNHIEPMGVFYTVTFVDWDGDELFVEQVEEGKDAVGPDTDPVRTGYTFTGWDQDYTNVTGDMTVKAQYTINQYTVRFLNWDGTVLQSSEWEYNSTPVYSGETPVRAEDEENTYAFVGWDKEIAVATADADYTAQFTGTAKAVYFTVTYYDWDLTVLGTEKVEEGHDAQGLNPEPTREGYTFTGWSKPLTNITSDLSVQAQYEVAKVYFTVTYYDWDLTILGTEKVEEGHDAQGLNPEPTRDGYIFTGWSKPLTNITSDLSVQATYKKNPGTGIDEVKSQKSKVESTKFLRDGVLYIMHNETLYDVQGQRVK